VAISVVICNLVVYGDMYECTIAGFTEDFRTRAMYLVFVSCWPEIFLSSTCADSACAHHYESECVAINFCSDSRSRLSS
jgi:hypothetical protein